MQLMQHKKLECLLFKLMGQIDDIARSAAFWPLSHTHLKVKNESDGIEDDVKHPQIKNKCNLLREKNNDLSFAKTFDTF